MKKKVLVIGLSSILGGVETYIFNLVKNSNKDLYDYFFLIIGDKKSVFENEINKMFEGNKNRFYYCPNMKKNIFKGIKWIKDFYNENHFDYIYMNTCTCAKFLYCIPALKKGTKLISHSHSGDGDSKLNNGFFRLFVNKYSYKKFACSDLAGKWLYGKKCKDYTIVPNGVDTNRFEFNNEMRDKIRGDFKFESNDIIIGHVGRFSEQKNQKFFIELANILPNNYKFLLIGDGPKKIQFQESVNANGLDNRFIILSNSNKIEHYYNAMDLFVMPSTYEGLPIVSVEAQTNGLICVLSDSVSRNSDLSDHCYFIPLTDLDNWGEIIKNIDIKRYDGVKEIKKRHFDICSTVSIVEKELNK